jgi:hypothetical protein
MKQSAVVKLRRNVAANPSADVEIVHSAVTAGDAHAEGTCTLDELAYERAGAFVPGFVKVDIEGAEFAALCGATKLLTSARPSLVIEVHSIALEKMCIDLVRSHGYGAPTVVDQRRFFREHRPMAHNRWLVW